MSFDPNDPRWTALALDELTDEERAEMEAMLEADPDAQEALDDIHAVAALLTHEFSSEAAPELTTAQRLAIESGEETPQAKVIPFYKKAAFVSALSLAAAVLLALGFVYSKASKSNQLVASKELKEDSRIADRKITKTSDKTPPEAPEKVSEIASVTEKTPEEPAMVPTEAIPMNPTPASPEPEIVKPKPAVPTKTADNQMSDALRVQLESMGYVSGKISPGVVTGVEKGVVAKQDRDRGKNTGALGRSGLINEPVRHNRQYAKLKDNAFEATASKPLSTFSIDVDTASYATVRGYLNRNAAPPADAVRIEEMINYFDYAYTTPKPGGDPFLPNVEVADCPWKPGHKLMRIGIKGREIERQQRPVSNLVFLLDVSGSMGADNKLGLLKRAFSLLVEQLGENDRVAIVVYAGASGLVLPSTPGDRKATILGALERLAAGGSTNGGAGIELAYSVAVRNFIPGGVNRVILATDGDFNVGVTQGPQLESLIAAKAKTGVFLSGLGFGMSGYGDTTMEKLTNRGNGNYAIIDTFAEARKVLVEQMSGTLVTIAKDVKIQVEFNPVQVSGWRLIGYANRLLKAEDFNDDTKDAGEIGAGHAVTALYELVPAGRAVPGADAMGQGVDPLKYQDPSKPTVAADSLELATLKLRYKQPDGDTSRLISTPVYDRDLALNQASVDFKLAAGVAAFGMVLRNSPHRGEATLDTALGLAKQARQGGDPHGYRAELVGLIQNARAILNR